MYILKTVVFNSVVLIFLFTIILGSGAACQNVPGGQEADRATEKGGNVINEERKFQGTWKFAALEIPGETLPKSKLINLFLKIDGNKFAFTNSDDDRMATGTFLVDPSRAPNAIDVIITGGLNKDLLVDAKSKGKIIGIYQFSGDTFKLCLRYQAVGPRPDSFTVKEKSNDICIVLRRVTSVRLTNERAKTEGLPPNGDTPRIPQNTEIAPNGKLSPKPGYAWVDNDDPKNLAVKWVPGLKIPGHPNVISGVTEGNWTPAPGYKFANNKDGDFTVVTDHQGPIGELLGRERENTEIGPDGKLRPKPGYAWADRADPKNTTVKWVPGLRMPGHPNVISSMTEREWSPARGYKFANNNKDDFTVIANITDEKLGAAAVRAVVALAFHKASVADGPKDPSFLTEIALEAARELARTQRDQLISDALEDVFPMLTNREKTDVLNLVVSAFDGKLDPNYDTVLNHVKRLNPDLSEAVQVTKFLVQISKKVYDRRR